MAPGRKNLYPAMPYASYHDITRADVDALWVWLQAQPAVEVANRQPEMNFPFSIRPGLALWNALERPRVNPPRGRQRSIAAPIWSTLWATAANAIRRAPAALPWTSSSRWRAM
jgi:hypothetical protein